jgi:hypothetical protein
MREDQIVLQPEQLIENHRNRIASRKWRPQYAEEKRHAVWRRGMNQLHVLAAKR